MKEELIEYKEFRKLKPKEEFIHLQQPWLILAEAEDEDIELKMRI